MNGLDLVIFLLLIIITGAQFVRVYQADRDYKEALREYQRITKTTK